MCAPTLIPWQICAIIKFTRLSKSSINIGYALVVLAWPGLPLVLSSVYKLGLLPIAKAKAVVIVSKLGLQLNAKPNELASYSSLRQRPQYSRARSCPTPSPKGSHKGGKAA